MQTLFVSNICCIFCACIMYASVYTTHYVRHPRLWFAEHSMSAAIQFKRNQTRAKQRGHRPADSTWTSLYFLLLSVSTLDSNHTATDWHSRPGMFHRTFTTPHCEYSLAVHSGNLLYFVTGLSRAIFESAGVMMTTLISAVKMKRNHGSFAMALVAICSRV